MRVAAGPDPKVPQHLRELIDKFEISTNSSNKVAKRAIFVAIISIFVSVISTIGTFVSVGYSAKNDQSDKV